MNNRFSIIDFETTGRSASNGDRIIEVGAVIVERNKIVDQYQSLVNPGKTIPFFIETLTGITNQMVVKAPSASSVIPELFQFIKHTTPVAHNASFDSMFLHSELERAGILLNFEFVCTLLLSKRLYPSLENKKLVTLAKHHGIKFQGKGHRALADAKVTAELFIQITNDLRKLFLVDDITPQKLLMWQRQPIAMFIQNSIKTIRSPRGIIDKTYLPPAPTKPSATIESVTATSININNNSPSPQEPEKEVWIKRANGLHNKSTGIFISFADTLRDVFPVPGYKVINHKIEFIKDSDIENLTTQSKAAYQSSITEPKKNPHKRFLRDLEEIEKKDQDHPNVVTIKKTHASASNVTQERIWLKTPRGLYNKATGDLISFSDTLRDVFPIAGYRVKRFPIVFIKDSEIDPC